MRIKYGSTRLVLIVGDRALKIGRFRPLRMLWRLVFLLPFSRKKREHFLAKYGKSFGRAVLNDVFAGLYANRGEYAYYQTHKDIRVMPTLKSVCGGWIVIQPYGDPVSAIEVENWWGRNKAKSPANDPYLAEPEHFQQPENFRRHPINGKVVLADYGSTRNREVLALAL